LKITIHFIILSLAFASASCSKEIITETTSQDYCEMNDLIKSEPIYNPELNQYDFDWTTLDSMSIGRYSFMGEFYKDKFYALGGFTGNPQPLNDSLSIKGEVFDIHSKQWNSISPAKIRQQGGTSELIGDNIYVFGGYPWINNVEIYNISSNSWRTGNNLPIDLYYSTSQIYNCKVFIIDYLSNILIFDIETENWTTRSFPRTLKFDPNSVIHENSLYIWDDESLYRYQDMLILEEIKFPESMNTVYLQGLVYKDHILFFGGSEGHSKGSETTTNIHSYNPETGYWKKLKSSFKIPRQYDFSVFSVNNEIYIIGGRNPITWDPIGHVEYIQNLKIE